MELEQHQRNADEGHDSYSSEQKDLIDKQSKALPNRVHTFYFIKYQQHEEPKIMQNLAHANFEIQRQREEINRLKGKLETIEVKHKSMRNIEHINRFWENYYGMVANRKSQELTRIKGFLKKDANTKGMRLRLPEEEELLNLIKALNHRMKNKTLSAYEEKKLMKQLKEMETTRERIMMNASEEVKQNQEREEKENQRLFNKIVDPPAREWLKSQVKVIERMKEMQQERMEKGQHFRKDLKALETEIRLVKERINTANSKMEKAHEAILKSEKCRLEALVTLNDAMALAEEKDIDALAELSNNEIERFFSQWSNNKLFKTDYERRVLQSLETRGLGRDGRARNSDETGLTNQ
ncbi:proton pump-interactor [Rhynchospora pubera]|uniref:Proton pump-interactor n=1 Tax=Rhynchospora pubera TaxID=906938 RepID=A0AAV8GY74_9POAL|nr:proton pump-interactor [Rhynchospora pubera]